MRVLLANPRGFCAGVERAIEIVERALVLFGAPIYVRHEVVHNRFVVEGLKARGVVFVESLTKIPEGSVTIFSAHGVSSGVQVEAKSRGLRVFDATCPLVTKVHMEVAHYSRLGKECILIGHHGHPEVEGTMGHYENKAGGIYLIEHLVQVQTLTVKNPNNLAYITQTTLSVDETQQIVKALQRKFPAITSPRREDICYATQNRQDAVKELAKRSDVVLVVGSPSSSNSNRLKEIALQLGRPAFLLDDVTQLNPEWCVGKETIGVTAGASAPEALVAQVIARLQALGAGSVEELPGRTETIEFAMPKVLR